LAGSSWYAVADGADGGEGLKVGCLGIGAWSEKRCGAVGA
jgi:hypothetical protein